MPAIDKLAAIEKLVSGNDTQDLSSRIEAAEGRIGERTEEVADRLAGAFAERLGVIEVGLRRLREETERSQASSGERQIALEASVRAQLQGAEEAAKANLRGLGEVNQGLVKLGGNQRTLGENFAAWRTENGGDIGIVSNRLQQLEHTLLELLGQLGAELQALRQENHDNGSRRGNGFKRWLYGTSSVFAAGRREASGASVPASGAPRGGEPS